MQPKLQPIFAEKLNQCVNFQITKSITSYTAISSTIISSLHVPHKEFAESGAQQVVFELMAVAELTN